VHVGGRGVDTTAIRNGGHQFCVTAVTIRNMAHRACWPITIDNPASPT
jgi:hypothetical protein